MLPSLFSNERAVTLTITLAKVVQYHLSALHWELRDTTLEFLGKVFENFKGMLNFLHSSEVQSVLEIMQWMRLSIEYHRLINFQN